MGRVKWKSILGNLGFFLILYLLLFAGIEIYFQVSFQTSTFTEDWRTLRPATVAIIPGAAVHRNTPSTILSDRLSCGLKLYQTKKVKKILLSGDNGQLDYNELKPMLDFMLKNNVAPQDVFVDHAGFRTLDTLVRAKSVFKVKDAVFVSQKVFLPRANYLGSFFGIEMQTFGCDSRSYQKAVYYQFRELLARHLAWWDLHIWGTPPKYLGDPYPISESGEPTWKGSIVPDTD